MGHQNLFFCIWRKASFCEVRCRGLVLQFGPSALSVTISSSSALPRTCLRATHGPWAHQSAPPFMAPVRRHCQSRSAGSLSAQVLLDWPLMSPHGTVWERCVLIWAPVSFLCGCAPRSCCVRVLLKCRPCYVCQKPQFVSSSDEEDEPSQISSVRAFLSHRSFVSRLNCQRTAC